MGYLVKRYKNRQKIIFLTTIIAILLMVSCTQSPKVQPEKQQVAGSEYVQQAGDLDKINSNALRHIMDGQVLLDQGDFAMAIVELQEAQRLEPNVSIIYILLAECYWNLNKPKRSMENLEIAVEIDPKSTDARVALAEQFFRLQHYKQSEEQYKILSQMNPSNEEYVFALADLAKIQQKYDLAIDNYRKVYELNNEIIQALELAAELAHRLGKYDKADTIYQELIKFDSLNTNYLSAYADVNVQMEKPEKAVELVKKVIEIEGSSAESLIQLGILYGDLEQEDKAIVVFNEILAQDSTNIGALHILSTVHRENEKYVKAQDYADKLIAIEPKSSQGYINSALNALAQEDAEVAIHVLSAVAGDFPEEYSIQYLLGMSYYQSENYKMAAVFLDNALQIAPSSRSTMHLLAIVNDNLENWNISDDFYQQLIDTDSTDVQALNNYAYSLVERGEKLKLSEKYSRRAIALAPDQAAYLDTYGWILFKMGDLAGAYKYIEKSLELEEDNVEVVEHMGDVLVAMKKTIEAKDYYNKALKLDPENQQIIDKINAL